MPSEAPVLVVRNDWKIDCRPDPNDPDKEICEMTLRVGCGEKSEVIVDSGNNVDNVIRNVFSKAFKEVARVDLNGAMPRLFTDSVISIRKGAGHVRSYRVSAIGPKDKESKDLMSFSAEHASQYKALMFSLQKALAAQGIKLYLPFKE